MTTLALTADTDDGWEDSYDSSWTAGGGGLSIGYYDDGSNNHWCHAAMRFLAVTIPQGSTVSSATLTLTRALAWPVGMNGQSTTFYGDAVDSCAALGSSHRPGSGWTNTSASAACTLAAGSQYATFTVDVTTIVQELINRSGWASGNALGLRWKAELSTSDNNSIASANHGTAGYRPKLDITYTGSSTTNANIAGTDTADTAAASVNAGSTTSATVALTGAADTLAVSANASGVVSATGAVYEWVDTLAAAVSTNIGAKTVSVKIAPFFSTDSITQAGFQMYRQSSGVLIADGAHSVSVQSVTNVVNGYAAMLTDSVLTLDADGGYRGVIVWDSGGPTPMYIMDEVYVPPKLDMTQAVPVSNTAGTVGDALNAARAQGFGKWVLSGTTLTLYAADGTTAVRTFTLDSASAPTTRT